MRNLVRPAGPLHPETGVTAELRQHYANAGHEQLDSRGRGLPEDLRLPGLSSLIQESWRRSAQLQANPDNPEAPLAMDREELEEYRRQHPLAAIMPVIHKLLVLPSHDSGMLVAVGDEVGRLLWVEGDAAMQRRAEGMMFVPGADWSEATVGTSAPGTALALGRGIQIAGAEHYKRSVHPWSCTAVPFHDPDSGALLGVVDITGTESAVAPHTLSLVEATVAAAQAHLRVERLQLAAARQTSPARRRNSAAPKTAQPPAANSLYRNSLQLLGRDQALLSIDGRTVALSRPAQRDPDPAQHAPGRPQRRGTLQPAVPGGWFHHDAARRDGAPAQGARSSSTRMPFRSPGRTGCPLDLVPDSGQVLNCLQRGAHRIALEIYRGAVLPRSEAPGIVDLRNRVSSLLRDAVLTDGSAESLLQVRRASRGEGRRRRPDRGAEAAAAALAQTGRRRR